MNTNHPRPAGHPPKRVARTLIPLLGILVIPGLWSVWTGEWFAAEPPDHSARRFAPLENPSESHRDASAGFIELASHEVSASPEGDSETRPESSNGPDDERRQQVVGEWEDDYQGHRHLTVRADGTATMRVEPSGIGRKIFADLLQFEIEWSVADDRIVMITTGGEPKSKTKLIMNLYGTRAEYKLLNLDAKELVLLDADGKTKYEWRRTSGERGASAP